MTILLLSKKKTESSKTDILPQLQIVKRFSQLSQQWEGLMNLKCFSLKEQQLLKLLLIHMLKDENLHNNIEVFLL